MNIRIGTRKSPLALTQADMVGRQLMAAWPGITYELVKITTSGDRITDRPLADVGGKGLFTKEIEEALLDGRADIAVHSMKDMATRLPDGLVIAAMIEREDPRDMLVGPGLRTISDLPKGATFATSSLRRSAQMLMQRPDLKIVPLRGNVETRLAKITQGEAAATMLAKAGLNRLGLKDVPGFLLSIEEFLPAIAQGAIGIECRADDRKILDYLALLSHEPTEIAVHCERAFLAELDGDCRTPIAGYAHIENGTLFFKGLIVNPDGRAPRTVAIEGSPDEPEKLGAQAGRKVKA